MYKFPLKKLMLLKVITIVMIIFAICISSVAGFFVVYTRTYVNGLSMYPTLNAQYEATGGRDIVYINRFTKAKRGDIVVLDLNNHPNFNSYTIKTLIAVEGDVVNMEYDDTNHQYNLLVNDVIVYSRPHKNLGYNTYNSFKQYTSAHKDDNSRILTDGFGNIKGVIIKSGEIYTLGDNWDVSKDSSLYGPFKKSTLVGRVDIIVEPNQNEFLTILKRIF